MRRSDRTFGTSVFTPLAKRMRFVLAVGLVVMAAVTVSAQDAGGAADDANAEGMKPLIVVSFAGFGELVDDLDFVGEASGMDDLGTTLEGMIEMFTQGQGLAGIDRDLPWGLVVSTDGGAFQILGFMPLDDLPQFLDVISGVLGEAEDHGDGIYSVDLPDAIPGTERLPIPIAGQPIFFKQQGDWTYVSIGAEFLIDLPEEPIKLLGDLKDQYDLGVRVNIQNIPEGIRLLGAQMLSAVGGESIPRMPEESDAQFELRRDFINAQLQSLAQMVNDLDEILIGATIDADARKLLVDMSVTAVPDSGLAEQLATGTGLTSQFGGFMVEDATLSMNVNTEVSESDATSVVSMLEAMRRQFESMVPLDELPQEASDLAHEFLDEFVDLAFVKTIEAGRVDLGVTVLGDGPYTVVLGAHTPKRDELVALFERMVDTLENEVGFYGVQKNVAAQGDVKFHRVSIPIPGGELGDAIVELFGNELEVVIGFGPESTYMAMGDDGLETLRKAIDRSSETADEITPAIRVDVAVSSMLESLADLDDTDANLSNFALNVEPGKDRVTVVGDAIENGFRIHVEAEEGILAMIGSFFQMMAPQIDGITQ